MWREGDLIAAFLVRSCLPSRLNFDWNIRLSRLIPPLKFCSVAYKHCLLVVFCWKETWQFGVEFCHSWSVDWHAFFLYQRLLCFSKFATRVLASLRKTMQNRVPSYCYICSWSFCCFWKPLACDQVYMLRNSTKHDYKVRNSSLGCGLC